MERMGIFQEMSYHTIGDKYSASKGELIGFCLCNFVHNDIPLYAFLLQWSSTHLQVKARG